MALEKMLEMRGVQLVLKNLLQAAAPQLSEQVGEIANTIIAFKDQCDRIERRQILICEKLGIATGDDHGPGIEGITGKNSGAANGAGNQTG